MGGRNSRSMYTWHGYSNADFGPGPRHARFLQPPRRLEPWAVQDRQVRIRAHVERPRSARAFSSAGVLESRGLGSFSPATVDELIADTSMAVSVLAQGYMMPLLLRGRATGREQYSCSRTS